MTIFMAYNAVYDACHSLSDGIWQLNTGGASLFPGFSLYPTQTRTGSEVSKYEPNARPIEDHGLIFDPLVLMFILILIVMLLWRLILKRSGIVVPKSPAIDSCQTRDSRSADVQFGYPGFKFDFKFVVPLAFHYSCLFAIATILTASDGS